MAVPPPSVDRLLALGADDWARVVVVARRILRDLPDVAVTPGLRRLQAVPTSRLSAGRSRRELATELADGGAAWVGVHDALDDDLRRRLAGATDPAQGSETDGEGVAPSTLAAERDELASTIERLRGRTRTLREERDAATRRADGAEARADAAADRLRARDEEAAGLSTEMASLRDELTTLREAREDDVARERRRGASERSGVEDELRRVRRELDEARRELARRESGEPAPVPSTPASTPTDPRAGRPTRLPADIARPSREAAELLVGPGRLVLVDGWNVSRTHRGGLDFVSQRRWLVEATTTMATRQRAEVTVVFDARTSGDTDGSSRRRGPVRELFAPHDLTADDQIVFMVAAAEPDLPVTVVTDDRGLRGRLLEHGVDLLGTEEFVWLLG